jgi:hypothetical protein
MPRVNAKFRRRGEPWTLAELKQLGRTPDSVLARRLARTINEIVATRNSQRIGLTYPAPSLDES